MTEYREKVVIVGSGAAGLTAAIYTARAGLDPLLVAGLQPGGQMTITTDVENYPGFADVIQGPWLMEQMRAQAAAVGARTVQEIVVGLESGGPPFRLIGDAGHAFVADSVIIASGAQARWLGLDSEAAFSGRGVSACATCDGFFFRGKPVAVIGGGNTAAEEALYLANLASHVTLVHRRDRLRAEKILQDRLFQNPAVDIAWNAVVDEIVGGRGPIAGVEGVRLRDTVTGAHSMISVSGCFIAIGHDPATAAFRDTLDVDEDGYIVVEPGTTRTSRPGIFAAGDCVDKVYRQAVTAAGLGCMAALEAEKFLSSHGDLRSG